MHTEHPSNMQVTVVQGLRGAFHVLSPVRN